MIPRRAALAVASAFLVLSAVELGTRVWSPQAVGVAIPLLRGPFNVPGDHRVRTAEYDVTVHVNADRFVDREWGPKVGKRVVVLGDSFVQAAQVPLEAGFGRVLDAALPDAEVLSMGVPGAGGATELGVLDTYALPRDPDVVLLAFLMANDVANNHPDLETKRDKPFYGLSDGELVELRDGWLWRHSNLVRWVGRTIDVRQQSKRDIFTEGGPVWEQAWAITDALVGAMGDRCAARGVRFATVLFAERDQPPQDRAQAMAARHGLVLDLQPLLTGEGLYFPIDGHWTIAGHRVAAEATAPFVAGLLE